MFKIGDEVIALHNFKKCITQGNTYTVSDVGENYLRIVGDNDEWALSWFKLKDKQVSLKDIIKPFMRVQTAREGVWIAVQDVSSGEVKLVSKYCGYNHVEDDYNLNYGCDGYNIVKVWHAPVHVSDYLNFGRMGELVWELPPKKSAQQIAVEELEASIKASQDKLEQLKRSL